MRSSGVHGGYALALSLLLFGCTQAHGSPCPDADDAVVALDAIASARCAFATRCYTDATALRTLLSQGCRRSRTRDELCAGLDSGLYVYDASRLDDCMAESAACNDLACVIAPPTDAVRLDLHPGCAAPACDALLRRVPTAAELANQCDCAEDENCVAGEVCGTRCVPGAGLGAACDSNLLCAAGLHCADGRCATGCVSAGDCVVPGQSTSCVDGACVANGPTPALGEPCVVGASHACPGGAYCGPITGRCQSVGLLGHACEAGARDACGDGTCSTDGTCERACASTTCDRDAPFCGPGGCSADATGASCTTQFADDGYEPCPAGLTCTAPAFAGTCARPVARGDACGFGAPCDRGLTCADGVCRDVALLGATCDATHVCAPDFGYSCLEGVCGYPVSFTSLGAACTGDADCPGLRCLDGACTYRPVGAPCVTGACEFGCDPSDRCAAGVELGAGDDCSHLDTAHRCAPGLSCHLRVDGTWVCNPDCA